MAKLRNRPQSQGVTLVWDYPGLVAIGVVTAGATHQWLQQKPWAGFLNCKPIPTRGQGQTGLSIAGHHARASGCDWNLPVGLGRNLCNPGVCFNGSEWIGAQFSM